MVGERKIDEQFVNSDIIIATILQCQENNIQLSFVMDFCILEYCCTPLVALK